jgi:CheY-like chemotaxis protein
MTGKRILVVEDDALVREACVDVLADRGHTVVAVDDGATGLAEIARAAPDVILLDLLMPRAEVDGLEFLSRVATGAMVQTPIVIVSAVGEALARELSSHVTETLRIAAILGKPVGLDRLVQEIDRALGLAISL